MLELLTAVAVTLIPFFAIAGLLVIAERRQRRCESVLARQVALTEAIHRELGAVAAPTVRKSAWGPWRVVIPVRLDDPRFTGRLLNVAHRALAGTATRFQFVLIPQLTTRRPH
jgi:hypothetical protein